MAEAGKRDEVLTLPVGTVTLVLADIEGSTVLWETRAGEMTTAIARFADVVAATVARHDGVLPIEQGEGDSFVAAFIHATDAVRCALALQLEWSGGGWPFRVRVAVHTGEVQRRDEGNYCGSTINRCARLRAIAHGGQTVLSQTTHDLVVDRLPAGASFDDMGVHRLRDLSRPEHVFRLGHPDLTVNPAPLVSLDAVPNNLPVQLSSFIGRERDIEFVSALLRSNRIVTLLGTGGCGKTLLSLQLGAAAMDGFADGIWFVELAPIDDPDLVPQAVATAMGLREQPGKAMLETLEAALLKRTALIVLDNCEHVVAAAARLASSLLSKCPNLSMLATTREQLGVPGEVTFTVPSLSIPGDRPTGESSALAGFEAVELFVDRAVKARPGFVLASDNAAAVIEICRRLDGIPLALELAAARTRVLSPQQICDGLADRFRLLTTGARTLMPRQQTLRASVDWSYALLSEVERAALRRMSIFAGSFDLDAAEEVVGDTTIAAPDVLDLLGSLVDKSLVLTDEHGASVRYRMLETIRHYGAERLDESGERLDVARRHRDHYRTLVSRAAAEAEGPDQAAWSLRVRLELDNVRAALQSALDNDDGAALIELTCGAGNTWTIVGRSSEHRRWLTDAIARAPEASPFRASALYQLGITDMFAGDIAAAVRRLGESIPLYQSLGDETGALWARSELAWCVAFEDGIAAARPLYEAGIVLAQAAGAAGARFSMEYGLAQYLGWAGHLDEARVRFSEMLARPAPVEHFGEWARVGLAMCVTMLGEVAEAGPLVDAAIRYGRDADDMMVFVPATSALGALRIWSGNVAGARPSLEESLNISSTMDAFNMAWALHWMSLLALAEDEPATALAAIDDAVNRAQRMSPAWATVMEVVRADVLIALGDLAGARASLEGTLRVATVAEAPAHRAGALVAQARVERAEGAADRAEDRVHEALAIARPMRHKAVIVDALEVLGAIAADLDSYAEAARLLAAAEALRHASGYVFRAPAHERDYTATLAALRTALQPPDLEAARSEGAALTWEEACDYAGRGRGVRKRPSTGWSSLTPTEAKVAAAVAEGLTNPQVGARLFISRHTVDSHLRHVYAKLGVSSRAELAAIVGRRDGADA